MFHSNVLMNNLKLKIIQDVSSRTWQVYINRKHVKGRACTKTCNRKRRSTGKTSYDGDDDDEAGFQIDATTKHVHWLVDRDGINLKTINR